MLSLLFKMEKLIVAKVLRPQGLKGQVKVKPYGKDFGLFEEGLTLYLKNNSELVVETVSLRSDVLFLTFEGLDTIEQIEYLRSQELFIKEDELQDLENDEYYVKDLLNCQVFNQNGALLGVITEVENYGAADVYTIKNKGSEIIFAFVEGVFESVDLKNKKVIVNQEVLDEVVV